MRPCTGVGRASGWKEEQARRPALRRWPRVVEHPAARHLELLRPSRGAQHLPQLRVLPICAQTVGTAPRGAGCPQQALPPATTHQPSPWLAGTTSPGSPHSTQLAAPALVQPCFLPLPLSPLPPAVPLAEFVPFRIAVPNSVELWAD